MTSIMFDIRLMDQPDPLHSLLNLIAAAAMC
jgi:hypothetical protein